VNFEKCPIVVHRHDLAFDRIQSKWLKMDWSASRGKMPNMKVSICFEKVEKCKYERDKPLPHASVLWFKLQPLSVGGPEKNLLRGLS
jgi:hypothetical protein